jgi:hypothetical protein
MYESYQAFVYTNAPDDDIKEELRHYEVCSHLHPFAQDMTGHAKDSIQKAGFRLSGHPYMLQS